MSECKALRIPEDVGFVLNLDSRDIVDEVVEEALLPRNPANSQKPL
jgi:hypothetical protein